MCSLECSFKYASFKRDLERFAKTFKLLAYHNTIPVLYHIPTVQMEKLRQKGATLIQNIQ